MHKTDRWYRNPGDQNYGDQNYGSQNWMLAGCIALWIAAVCIPSLAWSQGQAEKGRAIYVRHCERCHGPDGRIGPMANMLPIAPRNLADTAYMQTRTADQLFDVIKHGGQAQGLSPVMPGFSHQLSDEQVWDTVAYVRTFTASQTSASPSQPAGEIRIQRLSLSIWPEYDDPRVLVIIRGELAPESPVPTRIKLPMPKDAELLGAGMISPQNQLLNHPHERHTGDTLDTLELTLPAHRFFAEWYYDPFGQRSHERQFTYPFALSYAVAQLEVDILQPDAATEFRVTPAPMREDVDTRGGRHHLFSFRGLEPGASHTFEVTYLKTTEAPSITKSQAPMPNPAADREQTSGMSRETKTWLVFGMLAGCAVIFAGGVLVFRNKQPAVPSATSAMPADPVMAPNAETAAKAAVDSDENKPVNAPGTAVVTPNYCSNCGRQLQTTYRFCPGCGRPLQAS